MEKKDDAAQIRLINQALSAAASSINLARQLLSELTGVRSTVSSQPAATILSPKNTEPSALQLPGITGTFDGQFMITDDGQKFQIPENYASKSMIVFGDKLKMADVNGEKRFKQIERTKRQRASGMIVKKEGRYHVVTSDGSYKISSAAVSFFGGKEGDEAHIILPLNNKHVPFATLESVGAKPVVETPVASLPVVSTPANTVSTHTEKNIPTQKPVIRQARGGEQGLAAENAKEKVKEKSEKDPEPAKKVVKSSKDKEKSAAEKSDEKVRTTKETVTEKGAEKSNAPLIGDDELR